MRVATGLLLVLLAANTAVADDLTISVTTDRSTYAPGDTVSWQTWLTLSNVAGTNLGVQQASFGMIFGEAGRDVSNRGIGAPFADYNFPNTGSNGVSTLSGVGAGQLSYSVGVVEVTAATAGTPTLFAEGSFVTDTVGSHTMNATIDDSTRFYTQTGAPFTPYTSLNAGVGSYSTAVPEPSTIMLGLLGAVAMIGYSRRRKAKTKAAEKSDE